MVDRLFAGSYARCLVSGSGVVVQQRKRMDDYPAHRPSRHQPTCNDTINNIKKAPNDNLGKTVKARLQQFSMMNNFKKHALRV
ncbi:unnamed protein product, partial [Urochloa humidicola]